MLPYFFLFLVPSLIALTTQTAGGKGGRLLVTANGAWILAFFFLTIVIGFRFQVGGDWANYYRYLFGANHMEFKDLIGIQDPAYWALNILSSRLGLGMTGVNVVCAAIFSFGLLLFCLDLPRPWLALACAIPYLVIVVAMGYTRQATALGFVMIGLVNLKRSRYFSFGIWVLVGALFHKSSVLLVPLAALTVSKKRIHVVGSVALMTVLGYSVLLSDYTNHLINTYTDENIQSSGALIRLGMNAVPAAIFIIFRKRFPMSKTDSRLWLIISALSLIMLVAYFLFNLSTALDRLALYLIPLQMVVFSYLPDVLGRRGGRTYGVMCWILIYYAVVLLVWLNFAPHAEAWLPYQLGTG